jgi:hypothetical protein
MVVRECVRHLQRGCNRNSALKDEEARGASTGAILLLFIDVKRRKREVAGLLVP